MVPAFSSTKQAAAFALLLLVILLSPVLAEKKILPPREQIYAGRGWGYGPYPWIHYQIFQETNDIDIAFMGSSHILTGIDTPYVQQQLSEKLGRPAVVRTIAWGGPGYDSLYLIAKDLLERRKVRMLVFYDEKTEQFVSGDKTEQLRNPAITGLFRFGDDSSDIASLALTDLAVYYIASIVGMPRVLWGLVSPNIPAEPFADRPDYIQPLNASTSTASSRLGSVSVRSGFITDPAFGDYQKFVPFQPTNAGRITASIYSKETVHDFVFDGSPPAPWELSFARKFALLAKEHDCKLVLLHIPTLIERHQPAVTVRAFLPEVFLPDAAMVGIPPGRFFSGVKDDDEKLLFYDMAHMNQNGMEYFTSVITPTLLQLYETAYSP